MVRKADETITNSVEWYDTPTNIYYLLLIFLWRVTAGAFEGCYDEVESKHDIPPIVNIMAQIPTVCWHKHPCRSRTDSCVVQKEKRRREINTPDFSSPSPVKKRLRRCSVGKSLTVSKFPKMMMIEILICAVSFVMIEVKMMTLQITDQTCTRQKHFLLVRVLKIVQPKQTTSDTWPK